MLLFASQVSAQESLCAVVKIEIAQELTLERQGFEANMRITNSLDTLALEQVTIDLLFEDADGNVVVASSDPDHDSASFFISLDDYAGINSVETGANGALTDGKIDPAEVADLRWLIVPTVGAGGDDGEGRLYYVGAELSFTYGGESQTMDVSPDTIVVKPQPNLTLDYFLPEEVNGDNPFTPEIEPVEPYHLGVRIANNGSGPARSVKIQSAQPTIVENERGLLVDFLITGSFIDDQSASKSLLLNFGDIPADANKTGCWVMETSLTGRFTEFDATVSHADEFGGELTSLIESINTHRLVHDVLLDLPGRDTVRDFLAEAGTSLRVYESESTGTNLADCSDCLAVTSRNGSLGSATAGGAGVNRILTTSSAAGPVHIKTSDPYEGSEPLTAVIRADGKVLPPANYWLSKSIQDDKIHYDYYVNVFDTTGDSSYTLTFGGEVQVNQPPVIQPIASYTGYETGQVGFLVQSSDPDKSTPELVASNLPAGATFEDKGNGQGVFNWHPQVGQAGSYQPMFAASDGALNATRSTTVTIFPEDDRDGDGMSDDWERANFGDLSRDGTGDFDGDGILDLDEYRRDSDPTVAQQAPATPQLASPAFGAEVSTRTPVLQVTNGSHGGSIGAVDYTFEVYEDESLTRQVGVISGVPEGEATTEVTLDNYTLGATLSDNTTYYWRANARTAAGSSEWVNGRFFVNTANDLPVAFSVSKPSDMTLVDTLTPTLITNNSSDIDGDTLSYSFAVYGEDDAGLTDPVAEVSGVSQGNGGQTAWTVSRPLINGQLYYWVASVTDEHGATTAADPASFIVSTSNLAPSAPVVEAPGEGQVVPETTVTLQVGNARDPERRSLEYWFELDEVDTFDSSALQASPAITEGNGTTTWSVEGLERGQIYYWRAKADDGSAHGPWMTASFRVYTDAKPPTLPTLGNPAPDAWVEVLAPALSVHPATDPNGDAVSYQFELYADEGLEETVDQATVDTLSWTPSQPLANHEYYYWRARAMDAGGLASAWSQSQRFFINKDGIDDAPTLEFVQPDEDIDTYGGNILLQWVDSDPDSDATIDLYYNGNHPIAVGIPENDDGEGDRYRWNIDGLPVGTYTVSAVISDGLNEVPVDACCTITKSSRELAAKVTAVTENRTDESGLSTAEFDVVLDGAPRVDTSVVLNVSLSDDTEGRILDDLTYLEFTTENWSEPQRIRVQGVDDCETDGDIRYHLQFAPAVSSDPTFEGTLTPAVEIVNRDNEQTGQSLFICDYQPVGQQSSGGQVQYEYRARLTNRGLGINGASADATAQQPEMSLVAGMPVSFPAAARGESVWSEGSFTVSVPTGLQPNLASIAWSIAGSAPSVVSTPPDEAMDGQEYTYQVMATGRAGDVFSYSLADAPDGMVIDTSTGRIQWTPEMDQQGSQRVVVEVRDQFGGVSRQAFTIEVSPNGSIARVFVIDLNPEGDADFHSVEEALAALPSEFVRPITLRLRSSGNQVDHQGIHLASVAPTSDKPLTLVFEESYQLELNATANGDRAVAVKVPNVRLQGEGGGILVRNQGFDNVLAVELAAQGDSGFVAVERLRIRGDITGEPQTAGGVLSRMNGVRALIRNNDIRGFRGVDNGFAARVSGEVYLYNNSLIKNRTGLVAEAVTGRIANTLAVDNGSDYQLQGDAWPQTANNLSSDASSPNAAFHDRAVEFVDVGAGNYALAPWDEGARAQGVDLSQGVPFSFTDDINLQTREQPWDIGAYGVGEVSNWPPAIDSEAVTQVDQGEAYLYQVAASDEDGDSLTYDLAEAPAGMTISATGEISWEPSEDQVGDHEVVVEVTDGRGGIAQQPFTLLVSPAGSGGARLVTVDTDPSTGADYEDLQSAIEAEAGDLETPLLIRVRASSGILDTTPVVIDGFKTNSEQPVTIVLEAGYHLLVDALEDDVYAMTIRDDFVRVRSTGGQITVRNNGYEGVGGIRVEQQNPGAVVMLDALKLVGAITGEPSDGSGILAGDANATYVLRNNRVSGFTGSYTNQGITTAGPAFVYNNTLIGNRIGMRVEHPESRIINNLSSGNASDYESWSGTWGTTGHNLSSDATSPDTGFRNRTVAFVDRQDSGFQLAPWDTAAVGEGQDLSTVEDYAFATDASGAQRTTPWDIGALGVGEVNNWPPSITSDPNTQATQNERFTYQVAAEDPDGDTLTYALQRAPGGMTIGSDSGLIEWTPGSGHEGGYPVVVQVSDGYGGSAKQSFSVIVEAVEDEPGGGIVDIVKSIFDWLKDLFSGWFG
ncbi:putative Ig domain-containing protein [Marinobacter oulmenensis]|uniref:Dystroglycan-type cadherin-like domain-containing protein n=1 Tax=Marinobacter oulmenensis TaxID=643747 RepID=A0A840UCW0_9GAMM|nr:putative Ig domain-containing protein [Marinobacter oulmenensis]MBB5321170.1 hypothetical protein [Marinobacter oulmenensis]